MDEETNTKVREMKEVFSKLVAELNGKNMDYKTCKMLDDFFSDFLDTFIANIGIQLGKALEDPTLMKALIKKYGDKQT